MNRHKDLRRIRRNRRKLWKSAVKFLANNWPAEKKQKLKRVIARDPAWYIHIHLDGGVRVRNALRENGFGESEFGITNLDNVLTNAFYD